MEMGWRAVVALPSLPIGRTHVTDVDEVHAPSNEQEHTLLGEIRSLGLLGQVWTVTVIVFCVARAVPLWPVLEKHHVNPWWFLLLDIGTAPTYGLGQAMGVKILRDPGRAVREAVPWFLLLLVSFLAPYIYLLACGGDLPEPVKIGILLWILVFGGLAAVRTAREVRITTLG